MRRTQFLLWLDVTLLLGVVALQEPRTTSLAGHEWIGIGFIALVVLHLVLNRRWIVATFRRVVTSGLGPRRARLNAALNALLYVTMAVTIFSGLLISEVALPLAGHAPSDLRAWAQIHSTLAVVVLVVVGLHVALNWDWIAAAIRKRTARRTPTNVAGQLAPGTRRVHRAVLGAVQSTIYLAITTVVLCGATFLVVEAISTAKTHRRREPAWAMPRLARAPTDIGLQLLIVAGVALAGRTVLRIKL
jgi:hypothetical protein